MNKFFFVNIVNFMNDLLDPKSNTRLAPKNLESDPFLEKGLYVKEDDQDWGSAGLNDIQTSSE